MIKINTEAETLHETFGFENENDLIEQSTKEENKKLGALVSITMSLMQNDPRVTIVLTLFVGALTGLKLNSAGELIDYLSKSLSEDELLPLAGKLIMLKETDDVMSQIIKAMKGN